MERDRFADWEEIWARFERAARDARDDIGILNIIIAGRTGVGKSTLINAVFHGKLADTGQGEPVTKGTRRYTKKSIPLAIYDTRGLEMEEYQEIVDSLEQTVIAQNMSKDTTQHIHCAWVCVSEGSRRVEKPEVELHSRMAKHMPVLVSSRRLSPIRDFGTMFSVSCPRQGTWYELWRWPSALTAAM